MELNGINSNAYTNTAYQPGKATTPTSVDTAKENETAAVYEKSEPITPGTYKTNPKVDQATIDKLKADAEARFASMASLVEKLLTKQGETHKYATLSDLMKGVVSGEVEVDPEVVAQAKKDVAEDGYWGVKQTAERIFSFAKALTGGDTSKIEEMRKAVEKGFGEAAKIWGDELPEISKDTFNKVNELFDEWAAEATK